ncbi:MAG TPA: hypothetical protein VJQ43_06310, partial [Thermoplasmata archaeon]|nr:hypothetical protein [Thermoplasmata archaeon]
MPRSAIPRARLNEALGKELTDAQLKEALWSTKAEFDGSEGGTLTIESTADRLDLLTESGLALAVSPKVGGKRGGVPVLTGATGEGPTPTIHVDPSVSGLRPAIAGVVVRAPAGHPLDAGLLDEAIRFQELLHATYGGDRQRASLGIYPTDRFRFPLRYTARPSGEVRFVPLDGTEEVDGASFLASHPLAARFGPLGSSGESMLVLEDAGRHVLSVPPILNSRTAGEARPGDRSLLLESTGTTLARVRETVGLLSLVFVANGWSVVPVSTVGEVTRTDSAGLIATREIALTLATLDALSGRTYTVPEVEHLLGEARLKGHPVAGGVAVTIPPWRPDLLTEVDVAEDVVLARGVSPEDGVVPPSPTRGRRRAESVFRRRFADLLLGLGYAELHTPLLVGQEL